MNAVDLRAIGALDGIDDALDATVEWDTARPWPSLDRAARYGFVGELLHEIEEQTEADSAAVGFTLLAAFGNAAGPSSHAIVGDDQHPSRLFVSVVAETASGKGQSLSILRPFLRAADEEWWKAARCGGFASGESIIARLSGRHAAVGDFVEKRALVIEPEFARLLSVNSRDGSTSSPIIRGAWDDGRLEMVRAKETMLAEGGHVSIVAHITPDELRAKLSSTEVASGFANRFLFVCAKRSRLLPTGGRIEPSSIARLGGRLRRAMEHARETRVLRRTPAAEALWDEFYRAEPDRGGIVGAITARAHAQKLRLSVLYALLDLKDVIEPEHVIAAEAAWRYAAASAEHIFGSVLGESTLDRLLDAARAAYPNALDGTDVRDLFAKKKPESEIAAARASLLARGLIEVTTDSTTGGRPRLLVTARPSDQRDQRGLKGVGTLFGRLMSLNTREREEL